MTEQKALFLSGPGVDGSWSVRARSVPKPGPGELLVEVRATALNPVDWKVRVPPFDFLIAGGGVSGGCGAGCCGVCGGAWGGGWGVWCWRPGVSTLYDGRCGRCNDQSWTWLLQALSGIF